MSSLLSDRKKGLCFIVSAPAGTGKTTLVKMLTDEFPSVVASVSFTTRQPRIGEINGKDYHFITLPEFERKITDEDFLEYVKLYDDYYGTSREWIESQLEQGKYVVLVIDTQGAIQLKGTFASISIFISPPSLEELKNRLTKRKTEGQETLEKRLAWAQQEMKAICHYDYHLINDNLNEAYQILRSILIAESHKVNCVNHY